jgi:Spy/CpxP family protein refolding chaperone
MKTLSTIVFALLSCISVVSAQSNPAQKPSIGSGVWWRNPDYAKQLSLTDKEIAELERVYVDHSSKLSDLNAEFQKLNLRVDSLFRSPGNDQELSGEVDKLIQNRAAAQKEGFQLMLDERKILNPDQWHQMISLRDAARYEPVPSHPVQK